MEIQERQATLIPQDNGSLDLSIDNVLTSITGRFRWTKGIMHSHGQFRITAETSIQAMFRVSSAYPRGQIHVDGCGLN